MTRRAVAALFIGLLAAMAGLEFHRVFGWSPIALRVILAAALPAAIALTIRRGIARGGLDSTALDIRRPGGDTEPELAIPKDTMAGVFAVDQFVENLPSLAASRREIQSSRVVSDTSVWRLFGETDAPSYENSYYLDGYMNVTSTFDVLEPSPRTRVLVITGDPIGVKLAGPAIRAWGIAEALSATNDVTLMSFTSVEDVSAPFDVVLVKVGQEREFNRLERWADVIIFQGHAMELFGALLKTEKIIVADISMSLDNVLAVAGAARGAA